MPLDGSNNQTASVVLSPFRHFNRTLNRAFIVGCSWQK